MCWRALKQKSNQNQTFVRFMLRDCVQILQNGKYYRTWSYRSFWGSLICPGADLNKIASSCIPDRNFRMPDVVTGGVRLLSCRTSGCLCDVMTSVFLCHILPDISTSTRLEPSWKLFGRKYRRHVMRKPVMPYANNKGADQPGHPRSLISTFVVRCLDSIISLVSISEILRL